ncbi:unnamed protein product [Diatraea saccharalis]|uniref:Ecdysoneless n=1 Tax=Diatraea saccharalis TaxID=40085 RepID=A0A9N9WJ91_9NEOP|nr:unnamed protein product [Diatraea saccharalis]
MTEQKRMCNSNFEDTVHVSFFLLDVDETAELENLCDSINETIKLLAKDYIWHKEEFKVHIPITNENKNNPVQLQSTTCFGDNIEDEWFIAYLVFEISKVFHNLIIQMRDNDGDFLLIEAAMFLPSWANPENTENRVFIYKGHIRMVPPAVIDLNKVFTIREALDLVIHLPDFTKVSTAIEEAVWSRIKQYPQQVNQNFHNALVKLPLDLAALLSLNPTFISAIVESYCSLDMFDLKHCQNLEYQDPIIVKVKFTKCLYAMLMHSKYVKIRGHSENDKKGVLGLKLACGFQILMKNLTKDVFSTKDFIRFLNNLTDIGYFRQNIKDSKEYNELLEKAKQYFLDTECSIYTSKSKNISKIMGSDNFQVIKESLKNADPNKADLSEDCDDWLNINEQQLDELLNRRYNYDIKFRKDDVLTPQAITTKLNNFLNESSDFEGVDSREINESDNQCINFDADNFVNCLQRMLSFPPSENTNDSDSNDSDFEIESDISDEDEALEKELASKLDSFANNRKSCETVVHNITESIKEEGLSGPSSNILKTIGISRKDMLDSDDDDG